MANHYIKSTSGSDFNIKFAFVSLFAVFPHG